MKEKITVYIPTFKRWDSIITHKLIPEAVVVCPESQVEKYLEVNPNLNILACPDGIEGNIARKRNWIKSQCKTDYLIMIDDDIKGFQKIVNTKQITMSTDEIWYMFEQGFQLMEDLGTVLWGVNLNNDPKCYREYSPFSMLSPVLGPFTAQKNVKTFWYDERLPLKEDYDLSLQVLQKYHKVLRLNRYSYVTTHLTNADGGCVDYRTMVREEEQNQLLQKKWGKKIVKYNIEKSINPIIKVPLKGI
jgi:hypothetical protein